MAKVLYGFNYFLIYTIQIAEKFFSTTD
ncbi:uncharacterized protein METZ01_LOCUS291502 [marine metagenome]|uniref:Uncharacterized protein n=1 Tax=marine metagenome TaxID=408172 RepID=A0A382LPJ3_9ZZZZ